MNHLIKVIHVGGAILNAKRLRSVIMDHADNFIKRPVTYGFWDVSGKQVDHVASPYRLGFMFRF